MRLWFQLLLALFAVVTVEAIGLGFVLREERLRTENERFAREIEFGCGVVRRSLELDANESVIRTESLCKESQLVDRALTALEAGALDDERSAIALLLAQDRKALGRDALALVVDEKDVLGVDPKGGVDSRLRGDLRAAKGVHVDGERFGVACARRRGGHVAELFALERIDPKLATLAAQMSLSIARANAPSAARTGFVSKACTATLGRSKLELVVGKSTDELDRAIREQDVFVLVVASVGLGLSLIVSLVLARRLARPLAHLATAASKVAEGGARIPKPTGPSEVRALSRAFATMVVDLDHARDRLRITTELAAWRDVARRLAHELKNPLTPIQASVETMRRLRARGDDRFDAYFDESSRLVLDEVRRLSDTITEFAAFARTPSPKLEHTALLPIAEHVASLFSSQARVRVEGDALLSADVDRDLVVQVLTNLVKNSIEASAGRSERASEGPDEEVCIAVTREGEWAQIEVRDQGDGVAEAMRADLFRPYKTTKSHGTGLGLAVSANIAHAHGGDLRYFPNEPRGARFCFRLPARGAS